MLNKPEAFLCVIARSAATKQSLCRFTLTTARQECLPGCRGISQFAPGLLACNTSAYFGAKGNLLATKSSCNDKKDGLRLNSISRATESSPPATHIFINIVA